MGSAWALQHRYVFSFYMKFLISQFSPACPNGASSAKPKPTKSTSRTRTASGRGGSTRGRGSKRGKKGDKTKNNTFGAPDDF
ncbi:hypothetical protein SERLA73DRAFT_179938 [Serpula lacrymans var. lacrymans S7.3]|uniref:Uncharacterized protein n=2 Tax=Serpula lacrymans var. lacrymans TaxID=341189 RepID=F8PV62_SERL3|nr:uncharacterized protein SERLADRAFT_465305 [Serpula lacrymans var. lacrymans S7.9]EGN99754.1 hypothetical protein SERLA73DRAFT_179938 [Serpula lacrymans var. lacrymans S7.3]EGO25326.1 hypothetical protein SERLADRAFT_465305 [Serpula lacrymans var. lacrymans S7.9]